MKWFTGLAKKVESYKEKFKGTKQLIKQIMDRFFQQIPF
jgi:hypothetical protein